MKKYNYELILTIFDFKKGLSVCNGELRDHSARIESSSMHRDVVAVCLLQDAPVVEAPVEGFLARPCGALHPKIFSRVAIVVGAFYLVGAPHVAVVSFHTFARLKAVHQDVIEDLEVQPRHRQSRVLQPRPSFW